MFKDDCKAVLNFVKLSVLLKLVYKFGIVYYILKNGNHRNIWP